MPLLYHSLFMNITSYQLLQLPPLMLHSSEIILANSRKVCTAALCTVHCCTSQPSRLDKTIGPNSISATVKSPDGFASFAFYQLYQLYSVTRPILPVSCWRGKFWFSKKIKNTMWEVSFTVAVQCKVESRFHFGSYEEASRIVSLHHNKSCFLNK